MALTDLLPEYEWLEWGFAQVPWGFSGQTPKPPPLRRVAGQATRAETARGLGPCADGGYRRQPWRSGSQSAQQEASADAPRCLPREVWLAQRRVRDARRLRTEQILAWADAHFQQHGKWPHTRSGRIPGAEKTWLAVNHALIRGTHGPPGRSSLALLLHQHRGLRHQRRLPELSEGQIVSWAKAWHEQTGRWPTTSSGALQQLPGDTWSSINAALIEGYRGLRGGSTLAKLLRKCGLK